MLREDARRELGAPEGRFVLLLIGNDWRNKGVSVILNALATLGELNIDLLVVSSENPEQLHMAVTNKALNGRARAYWLKPREDVEFYYAAADAYVGPSLEDTFAQPPAEAMACGLPTIVSLENGTCEIITDGMDGMHSCAIQEGCFATLATMIRRLFEDEPFRTSLGKNAAETALQYTWERNGRELAAIFEEIIRRKSGLARQAVTQEP